MKHTKLAENIYWVGAIDWNLRNFHGYITPKGSTYNSYLIVDEKTALIDTVKAPFSSELIKRISSVIDPKKINYVISNHVEMDHSGSLAAVRNAAPNAQFVADKRAAEDLNRHFKENWDFKIVKTGDSISLGKRSLTFVEVPMVHWPDSMVTYCPEDKILFSNDAFGQHIATLERFDEEITWEVAKEEAAKYYANIIMPLAGPTTKALDAVSKLEIRMIAPSHGIIFRKHAADIVLCYKDWATNKTNKKAVVVYDTMWNSTEKMACAISEGLNAGCAAAKLFCLRTSNTSEIMKEILDAKAIIVGSPTLNNGILPTVAGFLTYLKGLKPRGRIGFAFGSFGWAGGAVGIIEAEMKAAGIEMVRPPITTRYIPDSAELDVCFKAAKELSKIL